MLAKLSCKCRGGRLCEEMKATHLLPHLPQALHTMEQVAAPQQLAAKDTSWEAQEDMVS